MFVKHHSMVKCFNFIALDSILDLLGVRKIGKLCYFDVNLSDIGMIS